MSKAIKEIIDNPVFFQELLIDKKTILNSNIQLLNKNNNPYWLIGQSNVQHKNIEDEIIIIIEQSKRESKYGLKLRCSNFTKQPFFRFDSDGPAHRNSFPEIPLEEQSITTPHFNTFKENGLPFAYKNDILKKENEAKAIVDDINFGISLFCRESNTYLGNGGFPITIQKVPEFEFENDKSINFDQISFD